MTKVLRSFMVNRVENGSKMLFSTQAGVYNQRVERSLRCLKSLILD